MNACVKRRNTAALFVLGALVALAIIAYMTVELNFSNERLLRFAMKLREAAHAEAVCHVDCGHCYRRRIDCVSVHHQQ